MHVRTLLPSLFGLLLLAGCAQTEDPVTKPIKKGTTGTPAPGQNNSDGEHGTATPAGPTTTPEEGTALGSETWADGKKIDANVTISAGATVEIAAGATITLGANVAITVKGTLKVAATTPHSTLTGTGWVGIVVAQGGTLNAQGLDIKGAQSALWTQNGNLNATFTDGVIQAATPFEMEAGSKLSITRSKVNATAASAIAGTFVASYMQYDKAEAKGLVLNDAAGSMTISDSTLTGKPASSDYVISDAGKLVKLEYTVVTGSHCALHFGSVDQYTIDHVSFDDVGGTAGSSYAAMLYGSGAGPNSIASSNIAGILDLSGTNGPLTIKNSFVSAAATLQGTPDPQNPAGARLADAQPRAAK